MRTGWRRESVETWGWPRVSFHGGPLQTEPRSEVSASKTLLSLYLLHSHPKSNKAPVLSLVHPRANHCGRGTYSVFIGLS